MPWRKDTPSPISTLPTMNLTFLSSLTACSMNNILSATMHLGLVLALGRHSNFQQTTNEYKAIQKMKRIYNSILAVSLGVFLLASCTEKENEGTLSFYASSFSEAGFNLGDSKASYSEDAVTLTVDLSQKISIDANNYACWTYNSDTLNVNGTMFPISDVNNGGRRGHTEVEFDGPFYAAYPGKQATYSGGAFTFTFPVVQKYEVDANGNQVVRAPMMGYSKDNVMNMYNVGSLLRVISSDDVDDVIIRSIAITARNSSNQPVALCGTSNAVGFNNGVPGDLTIASNPGYKIILDCGAGVQRTDHTYYVVIPPVGEGVRFTFTFFYEFNGCKSTAVKTTNKKGLMKNQIGVVHPQLYKINPAAEGELPGKFAIKDGGHYARFSSGNLQFKKDGTHITSYGSAEGTWRFAPNQYDVLGNVTSNTSSSYTGTDWMDLFGWGTSGWNNGATCYQPWNHQTATTDNSKYYLRQDATVNMLDADGYENADWGISNAISNGGNAPYIWRVLTSTEWNYIASHSMYSSNVSVAGVSGKLFYPYDWTSMFGTPSFKTSYTADEFASLENRGVVFLPNCGYVGGGSYTSNAFGYWSSEVSGANVYVFKGANPCVADYRSYGRGVRLISARD